MFHLVGRWFVGFGTNNEGMTFVGKRSGEKVERTAFLEFEFLSQRGHGSREIANGEIGTVREGVERFHIAFSETEHMLYAESAARKVGH